MWKLVGAAIFLQGGLTFVFSLSELGIHKREAVLDDDDYFLICRNKPLELGIAMDLSIDTSSFSFPVDFSISIKFLKNFLKQYEINSEHNGVRVSLIPYGNGIYTSLGFNLTTYDTKEEVIDAIGKIQEKYEFFTATEKAIKYMHDVQMESSVVRPGVTKVGIVLTEGNSLETTLTKSEAAKARDDGIVMFAIGVGKVLEEELLNIAGDESRVIKIDNNEELNDIKESLAHQTCFGLQDSSSGAITMN